MTAGAVTVVETRSGPVSVERMGSGDDLVLLHSLLSDRHAFDRITPELAKTHRVNLVDLPGFGSTPLVDPSMDAYGDVVGALLHDGGYDPSTTHLIGNGLGAFVALATALRHGDSFDRLVLAGCGHSFTEGGKQGFGAMIRTVESGGMEAVAEVAIRRIFSEEYLAAHPAEADERRTVLTATDPEAFLRACRALIALDYSDAVAAITNPTCVIVGEDDQATPPAMAVELTAAIPGAKLERMEGLAHAPQLQEPARFLDVLSRFLNDD